MGRDTVLLLVNDSDPWHVRVQAEFVLAFG